MHYTEGSPRIQISIYMTVRNGMPLLQDAVQSLIDQSFEDWHAVIVDDGSTDGTAEWLDRLSKTDGRFLVILTKGVGRARALNMALSKSKARFVSNLDADDVFHPEKLSIQMRSIIENPAVKFLCSDFKIFSSKCRFDNLDDTPVTPLDISESMSVKNAVCHSSVLMRKSLIDALGGYDENRKMQIDLDLWYRVLLSGERVYKQSVALCGKRVHENQSFENKRRIRYVVSSYQLRREYLRQIDADTYTRFKSFLVFIGGFSPSWFRLLIRKLVS